MAKPKPAAKVVPPPKPPVRTSAPVEHGPARRVVVERFGHNQYRVVELTYAGPPVMRKVLQANVSRVPAEDEVRIWLETFLGDNRFGDSGL